MTGPEPCSMRENDPPDAFFFDLDGTLVRTEEEGFRLMRDVLASHGIEAGDELWELFCGRSELEWFGEISRRHATADIALIQAAFHARYLPFLRDIPPLPGALACLRTLSSVRPLAIVSGSTRAEIDAVLSGLGVAPCIRDRLGCDDLRGKGKPDPAGYLQAASRLGVRPARAVAIEDSRAGVLAARRAGMRVIGVRAGTSGTQDLSEADIVLETLESLTLDLAWRLFENEERR